MRHRVQAWAELWGRYGRVWSHYWGQRREWTATDLRSEEAEFLPAALALQAKPVSPAARWVARVLVALVVVLVAWSVMGHIDIVVNAQGKIATRGQNKSLAAVETARVHALHVEEGQKVQAGDLLIELDSRLSDSDRQRAALEHQTARLQVARAEALLAALNSGAVPHLRVPSDLSDVDSARLEATERHLQDQWRDYRARLARFDGEIERLRRELPLAEQRARDYAELLQSQDVSRHAWMEKEQARLEMQGQLRDVENQKVMLGAELRKAAQDQRQEATRQADSARQEALKASAHGEMMRITAPIDGTVQQLSAHTVGGVVPAAQPLMQIVPSEASVIMEATVENRDIGFVREGQSAEVKIDTFEYTKYGTVPALVEQVSRDAIQDEKRGPIYAVRVKLLSTSLPVEGHQTPITPGMTGSVEIKTGSRRVIEYVLSPLIQHGRESLRER